MFNPRCEPWCWNIYLQNWAIFLGKCREIFQHHGVSGNDDFVGNIIGILNIYTGYYGKIGKRYILVVVKIAYMGVSINGDTPIYGNTVRILEYVTFFL